MKKSHKNKGKFNQFLENIVLLAVIGTLTMGIIDKNYRDSFIDLAEVVVVGYIGLTTPRNKSDQE